MKRFFTSVARFFWSWVFLKFILWIVTLVIFFYVEEDWRGARTWAATKAKWEAQGESFDINKFTPPPIPDDQNLAAIPLFKMEPNPSDKDKTVLYPVALRRAMRTEEGPTSDLPLRGNWMRGELPDMASIAAAIATEYTATFKTPPPNADTLAQFDALYPFLPELRTASVTRPRCRLDLDYATYPPAMRGLGLLTSQIRLSQILTLDAVLALHQHQPDLALEDIQANYTLVSGAEGNPTLVGGLVAIAMNAVNGAAISYGLAMHAWSDPQLAALEQKLEPVNLLTDYQVAFRNGAAESAANIDYFKKNANRDGFFEMFATSYANSPFMVRFASQWPSGWWDDNQSQLSSYLLRYIPTVDPGSHRVFPDLAHDLQKQAERDQARWDANAPWNFWFTLAAPPWDLAKQKFAYGQTWVDEARIACALERYRLAHGVYPQSLDALVPATIDSVPHDIINGEPYHYRLRPDGTFLLYSVGWNQTDDGGKIVFQKYNSKLIDNENGDWVWPTPKPPAP
jgi:hypothetical protein